MLRGGGGSKHCPPWPAVSFLVITGSLSIAERRTISNVEYSEDDDEDGIAMRPQSYARMRYRNRARLLKWAK